MNEHPEPPPEGELITAALKRIRPKLSVREAARRAGISEGWWRQVVRGYQPLKGGGAAPMTGSAEVIARMAEVVGVTPEQLEDAGRADAAEELRALAPTAVAQATGDDTVELTVIVNPNDPEPAFPPGGLRDQVERIIWAIEEDWTIRWAQIQARRAILSPPPSSTEEQRRTGNDR